MANQKYQYRVVTNGECFRIERYWFYLRKPWLFFGKPVLVEGWFPCDNIGEFAVDDDGDLLDYEVVIYDTIDEAKAKINDWTTIPVRVVPPPPLAWEVVWP